LPKLAVWLQYVLIALGLGLLIWFDLTYPQYDAQVKFYGAVGVITLGAGLIGWNIKQILVHSTVRPYIGYLLAGAGLVITDISMDVGGPRGFFWLGGMLVLAGSVAQGQYRKGG
jgi:hypothetical protein